jgi:hypothetical protein
MHTEAKTLSTKENQLSFISYLLKDGREWKYHRHSGKRILDTGSDILRSVLSPVGTHRS